MVHEVLAPGMEDGRQAQLGAQALLAELEQRRAGALKEQPVERSRVLQRQGAQWGRQREDPVKIAHGQQRAPLPLQPLAAALMLAGGAMAIATAVGPPMRAQAVLAMPDRPTQLYGTTPTQPTQHFKLVSRYGVALEVFGQEHLQDLGESGST